MARCCSGMALECSGGRPFPFLQCVLEFPTIHTSSYNVFPNCPVIVLVLRVATPGSLENASKAVLVRFACWMRHVLSIDLRKRPSPLSNERCSSTPASPSTTASPINPTLGATARGWIGSRRLTSAGHRAGVRNKRSASFGQHGHPVLSDFRTFFLLAELSCPILTSSRVITAAGDAQTTSSIFRGSSPGRRSATSLPLPMLPRTAFDRTSTRARPRRRTRPTASSARRRPRSRPPRRSIIIPRTLLNLRRPSTAHTAHQEAWAPRCPQGSRTSSPSAKCQTDYRRSWTRMSSLRPPRPGAGTWPGAHLSAAWSAPATAIRCPQTTSRALSWIFSPTVSAETDE